MATEVMHSRMCSNILGVCFYQHYGRFSAESRNFLIHIMSHDSSYLHLEFGSLLIKDNHVLYPGVFDISISHIDCRYIDTF